jgi:hypothetical protein
MDGYKCQYTIIREDISLRVWYPMLFSITKHRIENRKSGHFFYLKTVTDIVIIDNIFCICNNIAFTFNLFSNSMDPFWLSKAIGCKTCQNT